MSTPTGPTGPGELQARLLAALQVHPCTRTHLVRSGWGPQREISAQLAVWVDQGTVVEVVALARNRTGVLRQQRRLNLADRDPPAPAPAAAGPPVTSDGVPLPGGELAAARARLGWSQRQLSSATRIDRAQLSKWERGQVPPAWAGTVRAVLAHGEQAQRPHQPATRRAEAELRKIAKDLIYAQPGLTRARVTARMTGTSMARRRAIVEDLICTGQVLEYREPVEYTDGRVLRLRVLRCP